MITQIQNLLSIALLLPITLLLFSAVFLIRSDRKGLNIWINILLSNLITGVVLAGIAAAFIYQSGVIESSLLGYKELGLQVRIDSLNLLMYIMVAIIAAVVLKFSKNYLDGDRRQHIFIARINTTVAWVMLFLISGNIAIMFASWVAISLSLHQLLVFYPNRRKAQEAAHKKFVMARIGDLSFLLALTLLYLDFGTGNLGQIFNSIQEGIDSLSLLSTVGMLLVVTALLKSAQLPFHGWLIDVMEAPTPVSALLHAGLLNAGPFLIVRFAAILNTNQLASGVLFAVGGLTAIFGTLVSARQSAIKTSLAYSSVAHMGFSLMLCGLGVYSAAILHLVAHSFYKAHAFLSSGSAIDVVRTKHAISYQKQNNLVRILIGITTATALFMLFELSPLSASNPQYLFVGLIILLGVVTLLVSSIDGRVNASTLNRVLFSAIVVLLAFFSLEYLTRTLLSNQLPELGQMSTSLTVMATALVLIFTLIVLIQLAPNNYLAKYTKPLNIHLRNGLYLNLFFDKLLFQLSPQKKNN